MQDDFNTSIQPGTYAGSLEGLKLENFMFKQFSQADLQRLSHVLRIVLNAMHEARMEDKHMAKNLPKQLDSYKELKTAIYTHYDNMADRIRPFAELQTRIKKLLQNPA